MSTYDDASLVMIPSGYKTGTVFSQKPMSTDGQLAFTRSNDTATRVGPNGYIEKVRTNVLLQSNTFSTTWATTSAALTSGQAGYDGTNDAWLLEKFTATGRVTQSVSFSGLYSISVYAKKGTLDGLRIRFDGTTADGDVYFDLASGTIGNNLSSIDAQIQSVGGGWYRCSLSQNNAFTLVRFYPSDASSLSSSTGTIYIQDAQLESGDIATDYIPTTTTAVSVGPVANVPRLNYSEGCPSLLLEPQRTNLITYSDYFSAWTLSGDGAGQSLTANYAISPDGYQNADRIQLDKTGGTFSRISISASGTTNGTSCVFSVYLKANSGSPFVYIQSGPNVGTALELTSEWTRFSVIGNASGSTTSCIIAVADSVSGTTETADILAYGAQLESSATYPTSLIPTLGAAVTRGADDMDTTFASAFATNGGATFFIQLDGAPISAVNQTGKIFSLNFASGDYITYNHGSSSAHRIRVDASGTAYYSTTGVSNILQDEPVKMAASVTASGVIMYVNGVEAINTSLTGNWSSATSLETTINDSIGIIPLKQWIVFPTALTATQLAELTTL